MPGFSVKAGAQAGNVRGAVARCEVGSVTFVAFLVLARGQQSPISGRLCGDGNDSRALTFPVSPAWLPSGPQDNTIRSLATVAADHIVTVDLVVVGQAYCDIATLGELATTTGGTVYCYTPYNPLSDFDQLVNDLSWNVARLQVGAWKGVREAAGQAAPCRE